jgi:hypothetical protein
MRHGRDGDSALLAVARFRGVRFVQYLYAGDDVSGKVWDHCGWTTVGVRPTLLRLALETVTTLWPASALALALVAADEALPGSRFASSIR